MSRLDQKVKRLGCTGDWRKFYKDEAQSLKNDHPEMEDDDRTESLQAYAITVVGIRRRQLQKAWANRILEIGAAAAVANLNLPPRHIMNAAVMFFTCRAMSRLGLDGSTEKDRIYREACTEGGVEDKNLLETSLEFFHCLLAEHLHRARLEQMRIWFRLLFTHFKVEGASGVADQIVDNCNTTRVVLEMGQAWETAQENDKKVLKYLKSRAIEYHTAVLIPQAIKETQKPTYGRYVAAVVMGVVVVGMIMRARRHR